MEELDIAAVSAEIGADLGFGPEVESSEEKDLPEVKDTAPVSEAPAGEAVPEATEVAEAPEIAPEKPKAPAPGTWRQEAAARWKDLDPVVQAEVMKREEDVRNGISSYKQAADAWKATHQAIAPYLPTLQQYNIDPIQQIQGLMDMNHRLATGTAQEKVQTITNLAKRFGVDLAALDPASQPWVDPQVEALQQTVQSLHSKLSQLEQLPIAQQKQVIASEVEQFTKDPANIHLETVFPEMEMLLRADNKITLKEAYDKAVWANPVSRAAEMKRLETERQAEAAKSAEAARAAAAAKTALARKATGGNVKSTAYSGQGNHSPLGSIDDTLAKTLAAIQSRAA
jgi:hypothetical protein